MSETARAFWTSAPAAGELRDEPLAPQGPDDVVVRTLYTGISRGTESLVFHGRVPVSEYGRMRAPFMTGTFPFPVKYGYSNVGRVERGPKALLGRVVFCLFPHQDVYSVPATAVTPLPADLPPARAVLVANMETAINAVWDARIGAGDRIVVLGAGVVGSLVGHVAAQTAGVELTLVDIDPSKRELADRLGLRFAAPERAPHDCDVVFHASGQAAGLREALRLGGVESRVVDLSWYGDAQVELPLGQAFHARRLSIISSQVGMLPAHQRSRWTYARRLALAARLLRSEALDALLAEPTDFEHLPETMTRVTAPGASTLCPVVQYGASGRA